MASNHHGMDDNEPHDDLHEPHPHHRHPHHHHHHHHHHHEGQPSASLASPSHMSTHGGLSPEDIQELLGGVLEDCHPSAADESGEHHHQHYASINDSENNDISSANNNDGHIPSDVRAAARSERKRSREKQRRSDVNKQFATLTDMLRQIETSHKDLFATPVWTDASFSPTNRVELIARTIHVLQTLEQSHKRQKTAMRDLEQQLEQAKKAGEEAAAKAKESMMAPMPTGQNQVVMMVPMLIGGGAAPTGAAAATPAPMPFMPMAPPPASTNTSAAAAASTSEVPAAAAAAGMPAMPWMMPPTMTPWGMAMPTVTAPPPAPPASTEESKQPASSESTTTSNLAHCA